MNSEHMVPIVLHNGSNTVPVPAIKANDNEDTLFLGNSQEAEDGDGHASSRDRHFFTPERDFTAINQDGFDGFSQPGLSGPVANMLGSDTPLSQANAPATGSSKRKRAAANGAADAPLLKQMKKRKNNIDTLKAELARLEGLRDEAKNRREAEQRRTEDAAVSVLYRVSQFVIDMQNSVNWRRNGRSFSTPRITWSVPSTTRTTAHTLNL